MGIDASGHGEEAGVAGADESDAAIVAGDFGQQPGDCVVGVGAFIDDVGVFVVWRVIQ